MSGKKSVTKGKRYERRVAVELRKHYPGAKRNLQYQRAHGAADVEAGGLWVEVKAHQVATPRVWKEADKRRRQVGGQPFTATVQPSGGTGPMLITMSLKDFVELLQRTENPF